MHITLWIIAICMILLVLIVASKTIPSSPTYYQELRKIGEELERLNKKLDKECIFIKHVNNQV